ncbi:hypothetical protein KQY27_01410 [Methanobrevibacter sp. TMH8]|uniref:hypothetical protein n=1 Tax=Methanobrevibacter sp. TMH8 TaxID=2848611 RepID=UPI001CCFF106|nr:hypothetical protein [Methanobrevibacter sp. TMH8]MBZ9570206.1 hypothetical protein [Methanobrevibacter sp. TMH8]
MFKRKKLESIDSSTVTLVGSNIIFIWGIILGIMTFIYSIINGNLSFLSLTILFSIAFGSLLGAIVYYFIGTFLYNFLSKKISVSFDLYDDGQVKKISILPVSAIITLINIVFVILTYPLLKLILEVILTDLSSLLSLTPTISTIGQTIDILTNPIIILIVIVLSFVLPFLGIFVYNLISKKIGGIILKLDGVKLDTSTNEVNNSVNYTNKVIYINPLKFGLISAISSIIPYIIVLIIVIFLFVSISYIILIESIIGGFIGIFIFTTISAYIYNIIANKSNPIEVELK